MPASKYSILVLDDHVEMAQAVADLLEFENHSVRIVHNGPDAIEAYRTESFDLAFFDIRMPGMNGVEAFLSIKSEFPQAAIVMMSGFADEDLIQTAINNGALGLLGKPFEPQALMDKLDQFAAAFADKAPAAV